LNDVTIMCIYKLAPEVSSSSQKLGHTVRFGTIFQVT
jgi:hypothetical protein